VSTSESEGLSIMTVEPFPVAVVGGVDSHADTVHVAVISAHGTELGDQEFATTPAGYQAALAFLAGHGQVEAVGVEGTSSYGAGFTAAARAAGLHVIEVNRPDRAERRRRGKSDPIDAYAAARAVRSGRATSAPKDASIEAIRALHNAARSAVKARTAAMNQIHQMLVNAPAPLRAKYADLAGQALLAALSAARIPPDPLTGPITIALRILARRILALTVERKELRAHLDVLVAHTNPGLRNVYGVGPDTGAQLLITAGNNPDRLRSEATLAALCGTAPVPASSGKTVRHRLSRGGDRAANAALHRIALVRMATDPTTKAYTARQRDAGRSNPEILRLLKRAIVREVFRALTGNAPIQAIDDLRPARQAKNITLTAAAQHFGLWPSAISTLERGLRRDDQLTADYRAWLQAA
jgi:transposase